MTTIEWPSGVLKPGSIAINGAPRTGSGGASLSGRGQVVASGAGLWTMTMQRIPAHNRTTVLCWRAIAGLLEGRLNAIHVPFFDYERAYQPVSDADLVDPDYLRPASVPHADGSYFSDGGGYLTSYMDVTASASAALRATTLTATVTYAPSLQAGQHFSIDHTTKEHRLYRIKSVTDNEDGTSTLTFWPPLREAVAADERLEFDRPKCRMRLADDQGMDLGLQAGSFGFPDVTFIEDL